VTCCFAHVIRVLHVRLKGLTVTSLAIMARSRLRDDKPKQNRAKPREFLVSARPRHHQLGILRLGALAIPCALGKSGIGILKREGDGKTPLAAMEVLFGFYRKDNWPLMSRQPWLLAVNRHLGWCDAPHDRNYNRAIKRPYPASHETLARADGLYDCVIVLDWNMKTRIKNRGSAIFLHIAREEYQPTEGCIAVSRRDMMQLIKVLKPGMRIKTLA
jgi:L,D-peptidoglycan transpeptidase YkuD (ErfK/YbiS/YcfS/YnhG family)